MSKLLEIKNLQIIERATQIELVKRISFDVEANKVLAIIGESGSGKSLTCKALMGLCSPKLRCSGTINGFGHNLISFNEAKWRHLRGNKIVMIMQNGHKAFNPSQKIGLQMIKIVQTHRRVPKSEVIQKLKRYCQLLDLADVESILHAYPFELSGGMLQRLMIVLALVLEPEIIIADEPTTALDTITQYEVLEQFKKVKQLTACAIIFVSHDLNVVRALADHVLVMKKGEIVEKGTLNRVLNTPEHAYTKYLLEAREKVECYFKNQVGDM